MVLEAVHLEAMTALLGQVDRPGRERDRRQLAERLWTEVLVDPPETFPIAPIGEARRESAPIEELALADATFDRVAAVDGGALNPVTFQNGLVVDIGHAATATTPTAVDMHRRRTIVAAVHGPPAEVRSSDGWATFDDGYGRSRLVAAPTLEYEEETAVHGLSLEAAETAHAYDYAIDAGDLLLMDGSVMPASLLHWIDRGGSLEQTLYAEEAPRWVLQTAIDLMDGCHAQEVPIVGIIKNWTARGIVRSLAATDIDVGTIPWPTDASLFQQLLAVVSDDRSDLRWSSWFALEGGAGTGLGYAIEEFGLDADRPATAYDLAIMVVLDPREHLVFRIEAPRSLVEETTARERITRHVLSGIAREAGPPPAIRKADELARISRGERAQLKRALERALSTTEVPRYDELRWGEEASG